MTFLANRENTRRAFNLLVKFSPRLFNTAVSADSLRAFGKHQCLIPPAFQPFFKSVSTLNLSAVPARRAIPILARDSGCEAVSWQRQTTPPAHLRRDGILRVPRLLGSSQLLAVVQGCAGLARNVEPCRPRSLVIPS